jgi:hypothetical protein
MKQHFYQRLRDFHAISLRERCREAKRGVEGASRDGFSRFAALSSSLLNEATYSAIVAV